MVLRKIGAFEEHWKNKTLPKEKKLNTRGRVATKKSTNTNHGKPCKDREGKANEFRIERTEAELRQEETKVACREKDTEQEE